VVPFRGLLDAFEQARRDPQTQAASRLLAWLAGHDDMIADAAGGGNFRDTSSIYGWRYFDSIVMSYWRQSDAKPWDAEVMTIAIPRSSLENLLHHAAFAAHLVGHLDDKAHSDLVRQLGDHVDAIAHELAELLGAPDAVARDGAPMLTSIAGGAS